MSKHRQSYRKGAYKCPRGLIPHDGYSGRRDNARALLKVGTRSEWEGAESSNESKNQLRDPMDAAEVDTLFDQQAKNDQA